MQQREMTRKKRLDSDSAPFIALLALPRGPGRLLFKPAWSWRKVQISLFFWVVGLFTPTCYYAHRDPT